MRQFIPRLRNIFAKRRVNFIEVKIMLWLSKCLDIPVIVKTDGEIAGYVKNVSFDRAHRIFEYFCIKSTANENLLLPIGAATPKDAIILDSRDALLPPPEADGDKFFADSLLSLPTYTLAGNFKGNILDAQFTSAGKLAKLVLSDGEASPSTIECIGDVVLLKSAKTAPAKRVPRPKKDYPVSILSPSPQDEVKDGETSPQDEISYAHPLPAVSIGGVGPLFSQGALNKVLDGDFPSSPETENRHTPTRIICDYEFLLGRTLGADLKSYAGELLAPKGSEVTAGLVELARAHGKLVDLTLNSIKRQQA